MTSFNFQALAATLKSTLKSRGMTYADLGDAIGLTESGVQKLFAGDDCSIARLHQICDVLKISLSEVLRASDGPQATERRFTPEQESFFLENMYYFHFFWELKQARYDLEQVKRRHSLSDASTQAYLLALDKIGLIELHPGNRIKPLHESKDGEHWNDEGSRLRRKFRGETLRSYLDFLLSKDDCPHTSSPLLILNMKRDTIEELRGALKKVQLEFYERAHRENPLARPEELVTIGNLNAITPFTYSDILSVPEIR